MKTQLKKGDKWATNKSKGYVADMVKEKITVKNWGYLEYKIIDIVKINKKYSAVGIKASFCKLCEGEEGDEVGTPNDSDKSQSQFSLAFYNRKNKSFKTIEPLSKNGDEPGYIKMKILSNGKLRVQYMEIGESIGYITYLKKVN